MYMGVNCQREIKLVIAMGIPNNPINYRSVEGSTRLGAYLVLMTYLTIILPWYTNQQVIQLIISVFYSIVPNTFESQRSCKMGLKYFSF
jgi:hypothetical protein